MKPVAPPAVRAEIRATVEDHLVDHFEYLGPLPASLTDAILAAVGQAGYEIRPRPGRRRRAPSPTVPPPPTGPSPLTPKPAALPDDARRLAARMDTR